MKLYKTWATPWYEDERIWKTLEACPMEDMIDFLCNELKKNNTEQKKPKPKPLIPGIKRVIFNAPATIVYWSDRTKTVVKADNEPYNEEKGLAMAIAKKALGNESNYYEVFKKWIGEDVLESMRVNNE